MKKVFRLKLAVPFIAMVLVVLASAFTTKHQQSTTTSDFGNPTAETSVPADLLTSGWTNITSDVTTAGSLSAYASADHCIAPTTPVCVVEAQITVTDGNESQEIVQTIDGTFNPRG
jgi:hypothetical protein